VLEEDIQEQRPLAALPDVHPPLLDRLELRVGDPLLPDDLVDGILGAADEPVGPLL
jgi:hypothetical protein